MRATISTPALIAVLLSALPVAAQEHDHVRVHTSQHESRHVEVRVSGEVEVNDAGDWVVGLAPGGHLVLEERVRGTSRRLELRPASGGLRTRYWRNGRERALDDEGRAWARRLIREEVRGGGIGARKRVERVRALRGVRGVLDEAAELRGDAGRRAYYRALLDGPPLTRDEFARLAADAARHMRSDTELRMVLRDAAAHADDAPRAVALLDATRAMRSDVERRIVLTQLARGGIPAGAHDAFFAATAAMRSDVERRIVLSAALEHGATEAVSLGALRAAADMRSDVEKRIVLGRVPAAHLRTPRVRDAFHAAIRTLRSDTERSIALRRMVAG